jgi:fructokinase
MAQQDVLVAGETLIDFLPQRTGALSSVEEFSRRAGGAPANVAVGLARLDQTPLFWTRVGDDPFGEFLTETLLDRGIPDRFVELDPDAHTSLAFVSHDEDMDRAFTFYRNDTADTRLEPETVPDEVLKSISWVHIGGVTLSSGRSREATLDLIERAQAANCTVSFDPNDRPELWPSREAYRTVVGDTLERVDVLKATVAELRELGIAGDDAESVARATTDRGPHTICLTLGESGAFVLATADAPWGADRRTATAQHGGFEVDVVDTTGAGDAFLAGAISAFVDGQSLTEVVAFANATAASATTSMGAMDGFPTRDEAIALTEQTTN